MSNSHQTSRRDFLKKSFLGSAVSLAALHLPVRALAAPETTPSAVTPATRIALMHGPDRADNVFRGLQAFREQVKQSIGDRCVVIKPNNVSIDIQLAATHQGTIEGILEFLKSIGKTNVIIAESAASGPTLGGFENFGYDKLAAKYGVRMVDLDTAGHELLYTFDEKDFRPHPVRMSKVLLDPANFIISAARLKTHDRVVATLSLKNIVVGAPIKDVGFRWGRGGKSGAKNDKPITHGSGFRAINYNLFSLAPRLHPHLAIIDGYEGMEGNGPVGGTPVDHRIAVVGMDWLAADRVAVELMGIDFAKVGYLNFCASAGLGQAELSQIEVVGASLKDHIRTYKLANNIDQQLVWMKPAGA